MSSQGNNCQEVYVNEEIIIKTETENVEDFPDVVGCHNSICFLKKI